MASEVENTMSMESSMSAETPAAKTEQTPDSLGLRITVDLSESADASNPQEDFIVSRLHAEEEPEEEAASAEKNATDDDKTVSFVDKSGVFAQTERISKNVVVTRDRKYMSRNANSDFIVGIERGTEEWKEKFAHRGRRFGTGVEDPPPTLEMPVDEDFDIGVLYESVGMVPEILTNESSKLRLSALHVRGLDDMSTEDVLKHFGAFKPSYIEWIDDTSCNVCWQDEAFAARALFSLSNPIGESSDEEKKEGDDDKPKSSENSEEMEVVEAAPSNTEISEAGEAVTEEKAKEAGEAEAGKEEGQLSEGEIEDVDETEEVLKSLGVSKMYADRSPMSDNEDDAFEGSSAKRSRSDGQEEKEKDESDQLRASLKWRCGEWSGRKGTKPKKLYMRFATVFDKKQVGANKFSRYYEKYGNPNFGNMPGLISNSMRRRVAGSMRRQQLEEARAALHVLGGKHRDTDAAMQELAAMGAGSAVGDDDEQESGTDRFSKKGDLRNSGWITTGGNRPFTLNRSEDDDGSRRLSRARVGSSEGRCPPPSPRGKFHNTRHDASDEDDDGWDDSEGSNYSSDSDNDDPVKQLLSSIPARGRGSSRTKLHADEEEKKSRRKAGGQGFSKMRSDNMRRSRSRSRSRSPLRSFWVRPTSQRSDSHRTRSIQDRLGPVVGSSSHSKRGDRFRDRDRRRHDLRSRLG